MANTELTENSTKEEMDQYVQQVVKDVQEERAGTEKDDAQLVSKHADNEHKPKSQKTPADKPGREAADVSDKGEEAGESWLNDDLKAEVAAYGIEESEITDFASREELERALRLFDKSALEAGRKAMAAAETDGESQGRNDKGQFQKKEADDRTAQVEKPATGRYEITLDKDIYDEEIVGEFTRMRDHYESRLEALESRFYEADAKAEEQHFDNLVDSMGHADLFGKTGQENAQQLERRQDLHVAVKAQQLGLMQLGRPAEMNESLVSRVARMVFAEDLGKKDLKNRTRKISKQSSGRQGGGVTRAQDPREDPRDEFDRLYKELEGA